jgi:hypothetical protein
MTNKETIDKALRAVFLPSPSIQAEGFIYASALTVRLCIDGCMLLREQIPESGVAGYYRGFTLVTNPRIQVGTALLASGHKLEVVDLIICDRCGDSGFSGYGRGYDAVCDDCGGQSAAVRLS